MDLEKFIIKNKTKIGRIVSKRLFFFYIIKYWRKYKYRKITFTNKYLYIRPPKTGSVSFIEWGTKENYLSYYIDNFTNFGNPHDYRVYNLPNKIKNNYIISIREPIDRFISAYNHEKKEKYQFKINSLIFEKIGPAENFAEWVYSKNIAKRILSRILFFSCPHLHDTLDSYYYDKNSLPEPFFIIELENIADDCKKLINKITLVKNLKKTELPIKKFEVHHNSSNEKKNKMNDIQRNNLKKFLDKEYVVYNFLKSIKNKTNLI